MRLGVDFSEYGGDLAPATAECWKQAGISFVIVQYSARMEQHLGILQAAGLEAEAYVYLYWDRSPWNQTPADRTNAALQLAAGRVSRLWLDAEDQTHPYNEAQLQDCVTVCKLAGIPCGIYTGRWWWVPQTGNSQAFAHLPLWHAEYVTNDPQARLDLAPDPGDGFQPYGGWTRPTIRQFQGTSTLCGHSVDLNVADDSPGGDGLSDEERKIGKELWRKEVAAHNLANVWRLEEGGADYSTLVITDAQGQKHTLAAEVPSWLVPGATPLS